MSHALPALLLAATVAAVAPRQEDEARPPLGQHLRDVEGIEDPAGLLLEDDGTLLVLQRQPGRLLRVDPDGTRAVVAQDLQRPLDLARGPEGELYVSESWARRVLRLDAEGEVQDILGERLLLRPAGLAVRGELLFVADRGRHRVEVFDLDGEHRFGFGGHGTGEGELIEPRDVDVDAAGRIFVTDFGNSRVQVFDAEGRYLRAWGDWGPFPGLFTGPTGIVVRGEEVHVADRGNHRVEVFDADGELLDRFGLHALKPREGGGFLHYPASLALSPDGELAALAEPPVDRVQLFCRTGGSPEDEIRRQAQSLAKPGAHYGMELEISGPYLAISEPESHSIVFYENSADQPRQVTRISGLGTKTGLLVGAGGMDFERGRRDLWVCDPSLRRLSLFRLRGSEEDEVGYDDLMARFVKSLDMARFHDLELRDQLPAAPEPVALDRDARGRLYVLDRRNACVLLLSAELAFVEVVGLGSLGAPTGIEVAADGLTIHVVDPQRGLWRFDGEEREASLVELDGERLVQPHDLAVSSEGERYVTDVALHQVVVFDAAGRFLRSWGGPGLRRDELYKPRGIAFDPRGNLVVLDHANHRLMTFTPEGEYVGVYGLRLYTRLARYPDAAEAPREDE